MNGRGALLCEGRVEVVGDRVLRLRMCGDSREQTCIVLSWTIQRVAQERTKCGVRAGCIVSV